MAKQGNTKKRILELIANGSNNLTSISEKLKLAPSTVSKHLHDLEESGFIEKSDNYTKKWKYYKISANPQSISQLGNEFGIQIVNRKMQPAKTFFFVAAFLLVAVAIYAIYYQYNSATATYLPISITDPPTVPTGTQAIYINYSGMEANIGSLGNPNWVNINSSCVFSRYIGYVMLSISMFALLTLNITCDIVDPCFAYMLPITWLTFIRLIRSILPLEFIFTQFGFPKLPILASIPE